MRDLKEIRKDIDKIDNQLIELFKQRMDCARDVGIYKQANNIPVFNEGRENEILDAVEEKGRRIRRIRKTSLLKHYGAFKGAPAQHCRQRQRA